MVNSSKCGEFNKHGATFWCNSKSMGFAICASASAIATKWMGFGVRVYVIALGDMPLNFFTTRMHCEDSIWLFYLSRDDWFATVGNGECSKIKVIIETYDSAIHVRECGFNMVYKQDVVEFNQKNA